MRIKETMTRKTNANNQDILCMKRLCAYNKHLVIGGTP